MKNRVTLTTLLAIGIVVTLFSACVLAARGEDTSGGDAKSTDAKSTDAKSLLIDLEKAKNKLAPAHRLAYRCQPGEVIRTKVVHLATVETKIKGVAQTTTSSTVSTRAWCVRDVDSEGQITFDNVVERVEMWNRVEGRQEVRYDSATDKTPPQEFAAVAASVGKVLATITIDPYGRIVRRNNNQPQFNPGIGELTVPFPNQPVKPGVTWSIADELRVTLDDGVKRIQTRQQYRLEKVEAGVASISVETQVLTPINDPKIQSQLVQKLQRGTIRFDVDAGRLLHKQLDIDEEVFGFNGPDSHMQYLARYSEEPLTESQQTAASKPAADAKR